MKKTAVVICPGRGTYNKSELGYLRRHHSDQSTTLALFDRLRKAQEQPALTALDGADRFVQSTHTRGDHASALIYACSVLDTQKISDTYDVVAVTGNSMGWYTALNIAGAVTNQQGFEIVNTMGTLMQRSMIGGQSLYPFVDAQWREIAGLKSHLLTFVAEINAQATHQLDVSIHLGGMLVVAGNAAALDAFDAALPVVEDRYPMRLPNHAAFHTELQQPVAQQGRAILGAELFDAPSLPMIDGRGAIWNPRSCTPTDLRAYTLGAQVVETYDFTRAVTVAARSFAPDVFIIPGPGTTLGGAVAQSLIAINWQGLDSKEAFQQRQKADPVILSMGRVEDREMVLGF